MLEGRGADGRLEINGATLNEGSKNAIQDVPSIIRRNSTPPDLVDQVPYFHGLRFLRSCDIPSSPPTRRVNGRMTVRVVYPVGDPLRREHGMRDLTHATGKASHHALVHPPGG